MPIDWEEIAVQPQLPPGPRYPKAVQTLGWWSRPSAFMERLRARYGKRFSMRLLGAPPLAVVTTPDDVRELFQAPPDVLHPGEGARILEPVVGRNSLILLDEDRHLEQRKLLTPAFHGKQMAGLEGLMTEVAAHEVERWPLGERIELHPRLQSLTLEVILRAVFGLDEGDRLDTLRVRLQEVLAFGARPESAISFLQRDLGPLTKFREFADVRAKVDEEIFSLIDERRANAGEERSDVMAALLSARHEDGSPMSHEELRDELMTLLVAGHETTASELAWAFDRLVREPRVRARLTQEIDGSAGDDYLTATVNETLRRRPVLPNAEPRRTMQPVEIGGWMYPEGISILAHAYLLHHDRDVYPDPYAFRPERFLDEQPGTYTWIPFGGGRRRCIGASFAMLEMKIVLRAVLERLDVRSGTSGVEVARRRNITVSPRASTPAVLHARVREATPAPA